MANPNHVALLLHSVQEWNTWMRSRFPGPSPIGAQDFLKARTFDIENEPDLSGADLSGQDLRGVDLYRANMNGVCLDNAVLSGSVLRRADLSFARLRKCSLQGADLSHAILIDAILDNADCTGACFVGANMSQAYLYETILRDANLAGARLMYTRLISTDLRAADLTDISVYGVSVWDVILDNAVQNDIRITRDEHNIITVDSLDVAQFIYMLTSNANIRSLLSSISAKTVLILGRFTPTRKRILEDIRSDLRSRGLIPVLFDFDPLEGRDVMESILLLANMAKLVIADITDARCIREELRIIAPALSVPIQPIIEEGRTPYYTFTEITKYPWVRKLVCYSRNESIARFLAENVL